MAEDIAVWKEESTAELLIQINASPFGQSTKVLVQWNFSQNISGSNPNQKINPLQVLCMSTLNMNKNCQRTLISCKSCASRYEHGQELSKNINQLQVLCKCNVKYI